MITVRITKKSRNSEKYHRMQFDDNVTDNEIEDTCMEWCEKDSAGQEYGWKCTWEKVPNQMMDELLAPII